MSENQRYIIKKIEKIVVPNDKLTKRVFNLTSEEFTNALLNGAATPVRENPRQQDGAITKFYLKALETYTADKPLDQFDKAVLTACISAQRAGNEATTVDIIYRAIIGEDTGTADRVPDMKAAIENSILKLMSLKIKIDMTELADKSNYKKVKDKPIIISVILPAVYFKNAVVNGQRADVIKFLCKSPLLTAAEMKNNQLVSYDRKLLDVPKQRSTPMSVAIKSYIMTRVAATKSHAMSNHILFETIFKECRLTDATDNTKFRARKIIFKLFDELVSKGEIVSYKVIKKGNAYAKIEFNYEDNQIV